MWAAMSYDLQNLQLCLVNVLKPKTLKRKECIDFLFLTKVPTW